MIRSAFVLGAGLGTRLKTLTAHRPKPLIPVANKPLITYAFDHLIAAGVERFVVNTHHRAAAYDSAFPVSRHAGKPITFRHEAPEVLETAGGIKHVENLLQDGPFFVYNGDILSDLPLEPAIQTHLEQRNEVTLVLRSKDGPLQVSWNEGSQRVTDIGKRIDPGSEPHYLFTGIYLVDPAFFARIPAAVKISVIPIFLEMIRTGAALGGIVIDDGHWWDLGQREQYLAVHQTLAGLGGAPWVDPTAQIGAGVRISGATAIGAGARIGEGVSLENSIVWGGAEVAAGSSLEYCVVTGSNRVAGTHSQADL